ncbi:ABC transporter substrate-binding protein, partial [Aminivibrio pyruvatiphilus]
MREFKELLTGIPDDSVPFSSSPNAISSRLPAESPGPAAPLSSRKKNPLKILLLLLPVFAGLFFFLTRNSAETVQPAGRGNTVSSSPIASEKEPNGKAEVKETPGLPAKSDEISTGEGKQPSQKNPVIEKLPVKIGYLAALTGDWAAYGQTEEKTARLAVEQINAKGGVLGRP